MPLSTSEDNQAISEGANHLEGFTTKDQDAQNFDEDEEPNFDEGEEPNFDEGEEPNFDEGEEPTPTEAYLEEIREQVEAPRTEGEQNLLVRDTRSTCTYSSTYSTKFPIRMLLIVFHGGNLYVESMCVTRHSTCCNRFCDTK